MDSNKDEHESGNISPASSQRWILAIMFSTGFFFVYCMRVNLSVGLVCMVKTPIINDSYLLFETKNLTFGACGEQNAMRAQSNKRGEFEWDKKTRSSLLAAYFYGYIITQIPGGWLAHKYGGRRVFGIAMAISGLSTILLPVCARWTVVMVFILRIVLGLAQGVVHPACYSMLARWSPRLERTKLATVSMIGGPIGMIVTFAMSGILCDYGFDNGWGSIFYISGGLCCLWVLLWFFQVRESPADHPRITESEKNYIENNIEFNTTKKAIIRPPLILSCNDAILKISFIYFVNQTSKVPWSDMVKSVPLWAIIICHVCGNWGDYTLVTCLPIFMKNVLQFDIKSNGALTSTPYICLAIMAVIVGYIADCLRKKKIFTTTQTRKIFQSIAFVGSAIFLVATGFVPCSNRELAVVFLCISVMFTSFIGGGYLVNHIDIGARYAGLLMGITNTLATIPGMLSPVVAGALTPNNSPEEWRNVFYLSAGFYIFGAIFFIIFGSGIVQSWALDKESDIEIKASSILLLQSNDKNDAK